MHCVRCNIRPARQSHAGFSLVELAIGIVIVALTLSGLMMLTMTHNATQKERETERLLAQAREALLGFAAVNGRLPCPAQATLASNAPGAGVERTPTATGCTGGPVGVLPWATLGVPELGAHGRRFTYRVSPLFARTVILRLPTQYGCPTPPLTPPTRAAFALCSPGDNEVRVSAAGTALVSGAPAVIVDHGANGAGARLPSGAALPPSGDADEQENHDGDAIFVDHPKTERFDDRTTWIPVSLLAQAMLQAGRLP